MEKWTFSTAYMANVFLVELQEEGVSCHLLEEDDCFNVYVEEDNED
jgi:hypothetical protein